MQGRKQSAAPNDTVECLLFQRADLAPFSAELTAALADDERARRDRFVRAEDRERFALYRGTLRFLLAKSLQVDPSAIRFRIAPRGKPELDPDAHPDPAGFHFNVSHSGDWFCAAVARAPVGVDVELSDRATDVLAVARHSFHPAEAAALEAMPEEKRRAQFLRWWTAKEALLKAWGTGLPGGLGRIDLSGWRDGTPALVSDERGARWSLWSYAFDSGVVSVAAPDFMRSAILRSISGPGAVSGELMTRSS